MILYKAWVFLETGTSKPFYKMYFGYLGDASWWPLPFLLRRHIPIFFGIINFYCKVSKLIITDNLLIKIRRYTTSYFNVVNTFSIVIVASNSLVLRFRYETGVKSDKQWAFYPTVSVIKNFCCQQYVKGYEFLSSKAIIWIIKGQRVGNKFLTSKIVVSKQLTQGSVWALRNQSDHLFYSAACKYL